MRSWFGFAVALQGTTMVRCDGPCQPPRGALLRRFQVPLLTTAIGRIYLAYCYPDAARIALDILARSNRTKTSSPRTRWSCRRFCRMPAARVMPPPSTRARISEQVSIAVPIIVDERVLATIAVRVRRDGGAPEAGAGTLPAEAEGHGHQRIAQSFLARAAGTRPISITGLQAQVRVRLASLRPHPVKRSATLPPRTSLPGDGPRCRLWPWRNWNEAASWWASSGWWTTTSASA